MIKLLFNYGFGPERSRKLKKLATGILCIALTAFTCHTSAQVKKKSINKKKVTTMVAKPIPEPPFATAEEIEDGRILIAKSDCLACHKIEEKLVGPAYTDIAGKYPQNQNTVNILSQKVINGGTGVWGTIPMAPHPAITPTDANKMIKYILKLNAKSSPVTSK